MGYTSVDYRGREFDSNDAYLEVWLWCVVQEIDRRGPVSEWLAELRDDWLTQAEQGFGFGVVPFLDKWANADDRRATLLDICVATLAGLPTRFPDGLTIEVRERLALGGHGVYTGGLDVADIAAAGRGFVELLG